MSLRWSEKELAAHQARRGAKVVSSGRDDAPSDDRLHPPARSGGDSGQTIVIVLPGEPQGKARARFRVAKRGDGSTFAAGYTPKATREYERALATAGAAAMAGRAPLDGWVEVAILAVMGVPRSWPARKRDAALAGVLRPGKPDWDNLAKIACDGLNKIAFRDDSQISHAVVEKRYGEEPMMRIEVKVVGVFDA